MECNGTVTKVDRNHGYFEVDNKFKILLNILKAYKEKTYLPTLQSKVKATNLHKLGSSFVACRTTVLKGDFSIMYNLNPIINLIKNYKLGVGDLIMIDKTLKMVEKNFKFKSDELNDLITVSLFEKLIKTKGKKPKFDQQCIHCLNSIIAHFDISSVSECRYVDIQSNKFIEFPTWSFGVHSKPKNSLLFGLIFVHPQYGFLMFKDAVYKMVCVVTNKERNLISIKKSYALIENFRVITEVYKDSKVPNLDYLVVDFKDIIFVHHLEVNELLGTITPTEEFKKKEQFILKRKSTICVGVNNQTEAYLQVSFQNKNQTENECFMILPSNYTTIIMFLQEGFKYNLYYNLSLIEESSSILTAVENLKIFKLEETEAYFQELEFAGDSYVDKIIPLTNDQYHVPKNSGLFSFEAEVRSREFVENVYPEAFMKCLYGFTTLGTEVHRIEFSYKKNESTTNGRIYLSNWINRLMPLGIVPEMRVIVKNVILNKSKYFKDTIFTSFEIVAYEPKVPFRTANLFENWQYVWGERYYLSQGNKIPHDVIVWSRVQNIRIDEIKMINSCKNCKVLIEASGPCIQCNSKLKEMTFSLIMYTSDEFGLSRVIVTNPNILRLVLDLEKAQFSIWLSAFANVGEYFFSLYQPDSAYYEPSDNIRKISEQNYFRNMVTDLVKTFNNTVTDGFEIKCRRLKCEIKKFHKHVAPKWFYLDGRKSLFKKMPSISCI